MLFRKITSFQSYFCTISKVIFTFWIILFWLPEKEISTSAVTVLPIQSTNSIFSDPEDNVFASDEVWSEDTDSPTFALLILIESSVNVYLP